MNRFVLLSFTLFAFFASCSSQSCSSYTFSNNAIYKSCSALSVLNSFLHWNYDSTTRKLDLAYRHTSVSSGKWVSWAINPTKSGMVGCQSLVAYQNSDGSMKAYTSPITSYNTDMSEGTLSFSVSNLSATYSSSSNSGEMIIFATIDLPSSLSTTVKQVWQDGPMGGSSPLIHSTSGANTRSKGTIDLLSNGATGLSSGSGEEDEDSETEKKNVHGVLNALSWGVMMPIGVMSARYLKVFKSNNPAWFYIHVSCQTLAYVIGVAGWATGVKLGESDWNSGTHAHIGLTLFILGTLQVFALLLRPKPDHKYRLYWNIYHHATGYTVIALSIFNIFEGLELLDPDHKWKTIYIGILIFYGAIAIVMEIITWTIVIKRKRDGKEKSHHGHRAINGTNGYSYDGSAA